MPYINSYKSTTINIYNEIDEPIQNKQNSILIIETKITIGNIQIVKTFCFQLLLFISLILFYLN